MAVPISNNGSTFYNRNVCRSFNQTIGTTLSALSSQPCGEVVIYNSGASNVLVYDNGYNTADNSFIIPPSATVTLRGLTNSNTVSAQTTAGSVLIYYRTQFFSLNTSQ